MGTPAEYLAAALERGEDDIQALIDASPYPSAAVRTVAEAGDFRVEAGRLCRVEPEPATWFTTEEPALRTIDGTLVALPVTVTDELIDGGPLTGPIALGNHLALARGQALGLKGGHVVKLNDDHVLIGPIDRQLRELGAQPGDEVQIVFGTDHSCEVRRG